MLLSEPHALLIKAPQSFWMDWGYNFRLQADCPQCGQSLENFREGTSSRSTGWLADPGKNADAACIVLQQQRVQQAALH
ncbi:hypothetical protein SAQ01S_27850 [Sphingomonas aquatilis NBRC 16722]|nr:hypothetical protein SAQ01S_27850 [Sphingomonas aquatilis NBRC 16722]